ncbi:DNA repair protein RadA, partial [Burkholderia pseudomallei]|uniref:DNA repair protein RadA n=1 Tax=Burkholderia pseudomallei TaxID=28450 RepID=UPI0029324379
PPPARRARRLARRAFRFGGQRAAHDAFRTVRRAARSDRGRRRAPVARRVPYRRRAGCAGPRAVPAGRRAATKAAGRDGRAECPIARDFHARAAIQPMPKRARTEIIVA